MDKNGSLSGDSLFSLLNTLIFWFGVLVSYSSLSFVDDAWEMGVWNRMKLGYKVLL